MTNQEVLDARYGRVSRTRSSRRRPIVISSLAGAVLVLTWFIWANPTHIGGMVGVEVASHTIVDATHTKVSFKVIAQPGRSVACAVAAKDRGFNVVGWKVFEYPASIETSRSFTEEILTIREPVTGLVEDCWLT